MTKVLLVGETWISAATHFKGFDDFSSTTYHSGADEFLRCFENSDIVVHHLPGHTAPEEFPSSLEELEIYDVVILSDIGANSLLLHPKVWLDGQTVPNRLKIIERYVHSGGGLMMIGGYLSFQGLDAKAQWAETPVERVLPVQISKFDDRMEMPDGVEPKISEEVKHGITKSLTNNFPYILGANKLEISKETDAEQLMHFSYDDKDYPLLVSGKFSKGRSLCWASDMGPHWLSKSFMCSDQYPILWRNCIEWLSQKNE